MQLLNLKDGNLEQSASLVLWPSRERCGMGTTLITINTMTAVLLMSHPRKIKIKMVYTDSSALKLAKESKGKKKKNDSKGAKR